MEYGKKMNELQIAEFEGIGLTTTLQGTRTGLVKIVVDGMKSNKAVMALIMLAAIEYAKQHNISAGELGACVEEGDRLANL